MGKRPIENEIANNFEIKKDGGEEKWGISLKYW